MNVIPVELHIIILTFLAGFAVSRGSKSPLFLTAMYTAFFILSEYTQDLALEYNIDYRSQALFAAMLTWMIVSYAYRMKRSLFVDGFLCFSFLAIINILLMFCAYREFEGSLYIYSVSMFTMFEFWLQLVDIIMLAGIINGDPTRDLDINARQVFLHISRVFSFRYREKDLVPVNFSTERKTGNR